MSGTNADLCKYCYPLVVGAEASCELHAEITTLRAQLEEARARIEELEKENAKLTEFARWRVEVAEAAALGDHDNCRLCSGTGEVGTHEFGPIECPDCIVRDIADMARSTLEASDRNGGQK